MVSICQSWMNPLAIGDPTDTAIVLKYLLGDVNINVLDLKLVDVSTLFENNVSPSFVAATLVEFKKEYFYDYPPPSCI